MSSSCDSVTCWTTVDGVNHPMGGSHRHVHVCCTACKREFFTLAGRNKHTSRRCLSYQKDSIGRFAENVFTARGAR